MYVVRAANIHIEWYSAIKLNNGCTKVAKAEEAVEQTENSIY